MISSGPGADCLRVFLRLVVISVIVMFLVSGWFVSLCVCVDMSGS